MSYITLEIRVTRGQSLEPGTAYLVSASANMPHDAVKFAQAAFTISSFSDIEQRLNQILVGSKLRDTGVPKDPAAYAKSFGVELFNYLFLEDVKKLYHEIKAVAEWQQSIIRLRLQIAPPELSTWPWELLHDNEQYLCLSRLILFARVPHIHVKTGALDYNPPLRLLGIDACPNEHSKLDVEREKRYIDEALEGLKQEKRVEVAWKKADPSVLRDLRFGDPWDILHFIGHGYFDNKEGKLIFEDGEGNRFDYDALRLTLALDRKILLVFLNACDTARGDHPSNFAYKLAMSGMPAIVAMQLKITDETAIQFARAFYESVARGGTIDEAVTEARHHIHVGANESSLEWIAPILYINTSDGILFPNVKPDMAPTSATGPHLAAIKNRRLVQLKSLTKPNEGILGKWNILKIVAITVIFLILFSLIPFYAFKINPFSWNQTDHLRPTPSIISITSTPVVPTPTAAPTLPPLPPDRIGAFNAPNGDLIGISDGRYPFDTDRPSGTYKTEAAKASQQGNPGAALALWQGGINQDPSDGEAHIYLENQRVLGNPYLNIVLGVMMAGDLRYTSRDVLQGAYIAQHEYNQAHDVKVRLLIASSGSEALYATTIAQQIVQLAKADSRTIAVMGWTGSGRTLSAEPILVNAHLVMLSQHAGSSSLTGISPFRIVSPSDVQAEIGANYARKILGAYNVAVFVDLYDPHSEELGPKFEGRFTAEGGKIVATEVYKAGQTSNFQSLLDHALKNNPDLIYFSGNSSDISALLTFLPTTGPFANLRVMTGAAGAGVGSLPTHIGYKTGRLRQFPNTFCAKPRTLLPFARKFCRFVP
jgi:ABC-type branched-subunit amino acid transport system substrate-binding protein